MLHIHQYNMCILYKPSPDLYIVDWLSQHNHAENRDGEIAGMNISIYILNTAIDIPICTLIEYIRTAMSKDAELQILQAHIIREWLQSKDELEPSLSGYWPTRHDLVMIESVAMKGK